MKGYSGYFDPEVIDDLQSSPEVEYIEPVHIARIALSIPPSYQNTYPITYPVRTPTAPFRSAREAIDSLGFQVQPNPPSWGLARVSQRKLPLGDQYVYPDSAG